MQTLHNYAASVDQHQHMHVKYSVTQVFKKTYNIQAREGRHLEELFAL